MATKNKTPHVPEPIKQYVPTPKGRFAGEGKVQCGGCGKLFTLSHAVNQSGRIPKHKDSSGEKCLGSGGSFGWAD